MRAGREPGRYTLCEGEVQVVDGFVDLVGVFVADCNAVNACMAEGEAHGLLAVGAVGKRAFADQLHADDAHSGGARLMDMRYNLAHIAGHVPTVGFVVHLHALVVHADHGDVEPFVAGNLPQRLQPVDRGAVGANGIARLSFEYCVLPAQAVHRPGCAGLDMQQHDIEVVGIAVLAQLVELLRRVGVVGGLHLGHEPVAVAGEAFEGHAEHLLRRSVGFRGLKEANAVIIGVVDQPGELLLAELLLHRSAVGSGAEGETGDVDAGATQVDPVGGRGAFGQKRRAVEAGNGACGGAGLQEISARKTRHE